MSTLTSWARRIFPVLALAAVGSLVSCAKPATDVLPSGTMNILGPVPAFEPNALPLDWVTDGKVGPGQLSVVHLDGIPSLKVVNGQHSFVAVKPTRASLLATPYLSWSWNMEPQGKGIHPVRLVVGFHGGVSNNPGWESQPLALPGVILPPHDRAIVIVWGPSALARGSITKPQSKPRNQAAPRYTARGGSENTGNWWFETIDLQDIYRRTWPGDAIPNTRISFIGIAAAPGRKASAGYISGLRLSR